MQFCCRGCRSTLYKQRDIPCGLQIGWDLARKNHDNHLTGTKKSEETKQKIRKSNREFFREHPEVAKERGRKLAINSKHKTDLILLIRSSVENIAWKKAVFARDDYTCQVCGKKNSHDLQAHHIEPISLILHRNGIVQCNYENLQRAKKLSSLWNVENGQVLCKACHKTVHKKNNTYIKRWRKEC